VSHLRANLLLVVLTLLICCVLYPAVLWGVGQLAFSATADGSLLVGPNGQPAGSALIAQAFTGAEYFHPRPSAADYNAAAAGASNWAASNPKLRSRVARQLGPIVKYADDPANGDHRGKPVGPDLQGVPFDTWLQKHPDALLQKVPADIVTASGSGLDPHITLRNARHQLARVAAARGGEIAEIDALLHEHAHSPLAGLAGEPLINVLEINLELDKRLPKPAPR
jgi:potassium-transporting ATPase KdpC subunit